MSLQAEKTYPTLFTPLEWIEECSSDSIVINDPIGINQNYKDYFFRHGYNSSVFVRVVNKDYVASSKKIAELCDNEICIGNWRIIFCPYGSLEHTDTPEKWGLYYFDEDGFTEVCNRLPQSKVKTPPFITNRPKEMSIFHKEALRLRSQLWQALQNQNKTSSL